MAQRFTAQEIMAEAVIPASRPIDHARRIGAAVFLGLIGGTIVAVITLPSLPDIPVLVGVLLGSAVVGAACLVPWFIRPRPHGGPVPVVARVLPTDETRAVRMVGKTGILVPVVCRPATGRGEDFRAVVVVRRTVGDDIDDIPAGMLMALMQTEAGMGELESMPEDTITVEQDELMRTLEAKPKEPRKNAPVLPLRRGALERTPLWAALEFWGGVIAAALASAYGIGAFV